MLFILNRQEKVVGVLKNSGKNGVPFFNDLLTEDLATGSETFEFTTVSLSKDFLFNVNYQRYAIYVCLISIIVLIILSGLKALKYMGISFIINAVINIIILLVLKLSPISSIQDVLSNLYNGVVTYYIRFTITYLIVGIIAIILGVNTNKEKGL